MRNNPLILVGVVVLGLLAVALTAFVFLAGRGNNQQAAPVAEAPPETVQTWVASREIPPRTAITIDMLEQRDVPVSEAENAISDRDQILGRLVAQPIRAGQTISENALSPELGRVVPANFPVPPGLRAVAVYVNAERTVAGLVDVGDRVDVIVTHPLSVPNVFGGDKLETVSGRTIAQNLEVLAVDKSLDKASAPVVAEAPADPNAPPPPPPPPPPPEGEQAPAAEEPNYRVVLAAPPNVAERIAAANRSGEINLTIRNPDSNDIVPDPDQALEYPVRMVASSPAASAEERQAAQERAEKIRQERRAERLAAAERAEARRMQRMEFENQIELAKLNRPVPPMPTVDLPRPADDRPAAAGPPPAPPMKEVLVVRGTEKTRVAVPDR